MAEEIQKENSKFCPKIESINNNMTSLSYNEKLQLVEKEAQSLYSFCLKKRFTNDEIHKCVSQLRGPPLVKTKKALQDSSSSLFTLSIFIGIIAIICVSDFGYNMFVVHAKLASMKLLPYWDWSTLYKEDCVITNNWLPEEKTVVNKRFCKYCTEVKKYGNIIDRLNNTNPQEMSKHYIPVGQPVVITDTTRDWISKKKLSMDEIAHLYQNEGALVTSMGSCDYTTNVGFNETFYDFITAYVDKKLPEKWAANWQNCDIEGAKIFRQYYTRPYFLPNMAQAVPVNSIAASMGQFPDEWFFVPKDSNHISASWMTVVTGAIKVQLTPHDECMAKFGCVDSEVTLQAGQSVFYTGSWEHMYTPVDDSLTLVISSSVIWDES